MSDVAAPPASRLGNLTTRVRGLARRLGAAAARRPDGRAGDAALSAAERVARLLDPGAPWLEIGALRGHDRYDGAVPGMALLTGVGVCGERPLVVAASMAATGGGAWWPETVDKLLRVQEMALRQRLPLVYLLEGGRLASGPCVESHFPGHYGPARALALATRLRASGVPQIAVRFGPLGPPGALLAEVAGESRDIDEGGLAAVRRRLHELSAPARVVPSLEPPREPASSPATVGEVLPADHRRSYDMRAVLRCLLDAGELDELQPRFAAEMLCGHARIAGWPVAVIANRRGVVATPGEPPRLGGIIYTDSSSKVAYFIETASRQGIPILFVQDVSGFMLGVDAEHSGIIRAGAELVEAMATAKSARIALTINHASGAGYYAMASQGFEPDFTLAWPTGRIGAMEAEAAINAAHGTVLARSGGNEAAAPPAVRASIAAMRQSFERELDAVHAASEGHVDAIIEPETTRDTLAFLLRVTTRVAAASDS